MVAHRFFEKVINQGNLTVTDARGVTRTYGDGTGEEIRITLHDRKTEWRVLLNPMLAVGECYMDETFTVDQGTIYQFLSMAAKNFNNLDHLLTYRLLKRIETPLRHLRTFNPLSRARKNVAHHYDLSSELYDLFLDKDWQYSCAYFRSDDVTLEQAQSDKKQHIANKLLLQRPGLKILDIGSGWGGMGLFLAEQNGGAVDGVTLSEEQHKRSNARAKELGVDDRVKFHLRDYRNQKGTYDRIVSVGMFEHVGSSHYREFFRKCRELLADDGVMLLHSIGTMGPPGGTNPWIRKYIFPGGYTPSLSEVMRAVEREDLYVTDVEIWRLHYAKTLAHWSERFQANRDKVKELYDERFCRMWEFYLAGCQVSFEDMPQMVFHLQLAKNKEAVPLTRDYITEAWLEIDGEKRPKQSHAAE